MRSRCGAHHHETSRAVEAHRAPRASPALRPSIIMPPRASPSPAFCACAPLRRAAPARLRNGSSDQCASRRAFATLSISRRAVLRALPLLPLLLPSFPAVASPPPPPLDKSVTPVLMCRRIMTPVQRYIREGAWDKGRTNVNYCTRVLALRKNMRAAAEQLRGDDYYDALDISADLENTMTQLDASLYTPLFIPADDGVSVEQAKYQAQASNYYADAVSSIDTFLSKLPADVLERARTKAAAAKFEISFEEE
ncbi:unnamed protein product [Agarophyton chilense]|eukprot:gb/GEZJ01001095.1/.p2 GENE.gb/GEZJ01001095.1/~~gb/GEZJ01001095.1/.p2  ORF type:complete len:252 (-),score=46.84 gb/GEZJ01001095.1/:1171-1926(-)